MNTNKLKNFVILLLMVAAIYQTGKLWLGDTASHNFFYPVFGWGQTKNPVATDGQLLLPTQFAIGEGDRKFSMGHPDEPSNQALWEKANGFFVEAMDDGNFLGKTDLNWEDLLSPRVMVLQYDFHLSFPTLFQGMPKLSKQGQGMVFDTIILQPQSTKEDTSFVYFVHTDENVVLPVQISKSRYGMTLSEYLTYGEEALFYVSTGQSGFKLFTSNVFVPQWGKEGLPYASITSYDPFLQSGGVNRMELENAIGGFFRNFTAEWSTKEEDGTLAFSDDAVVVRYDPKRSSLEYYSYGSYEEQGKVSLVLGYQICKQFMAADKSLQSGLVLADVVEQNGELVYSFDYVLEGHRVRLSKEVQAEFGARHAVEIVVRNNTVKKYRRYVRNFAVSQEQNNILTVDFMTALDNAILTHQKDNPEGVVTKVTNMELSYFIEQSGQMGLYWSTVLYGKEYGE